MSLISPSIFGLRRNPRLLQVPPYISALCVLVGLVWLLLLPLDQYSRQTYISENALLPGQVHTYFGGSEQNIFNAYKLEVQTLARNDEAEISHQIAEIFKASGLKVAKQNYHYEAAGNIYEGENIYSVIYAPRGDATEAVVLVASWRNMAGEINQSGVALLLTLARYFKRWSLWSKDIIFLITPDSKAGPQAWVDAYHDAHTSPAVASLVLKSGTLQAALVIDFALDHRFESVHIAYDGINGQLPNLDLFNTAVSIASGQMGIGVALQRMWKHGDTYKDRLQTTLRGMASQGLGHSSGPHSSFIPYHIDAITLQAVGNGWQDEMAMGRCVESIFRSLNNLLEHLHQSFFFYLLMQANRFVSIGTYLPSAMIIAVNFTIMAISFWAQSGRHPKTSSVPTQYIEKKLKIEMQVVKEKGMIALIPEREITVGERHLLLPLISVLSIHFLGVFPLYIFNNCTQAHMVPTLVGFSLLNFLLPTLLSTLLSRYAHPTDQQRLLMKCFSLLILGMFLATLATLNFSLSFLIGLLAFPLSFIGVPSERLSVQEKQTSSQFAKSTFANVILHLSSPPMVVCMACQTFGVGVEDVLTEAAFGWKVWGLWTQVVVWCIWWPAWLLGTVFESPSM